MYTIRPFHHDATDYQTLSDIHNARFPESPVAPSEWKYWYDNRNQGNLYNCYIAEKAGQPAAYLRLQNPSWTDEKGLYMIATYLHPEQACRSLAEVVYSYLLDELITLEAEQVLTITYESKTELVAFLEEKGFQQKMRYPVSRLNVQQFESAKFAPVLERVAASGVEILNLKLFSQREPDWKKALWDLDWAIVQDVPAVKPLSRPTFERFEKTTLQGPNFLAESFILALHGNELVGMSQLAQSQSDPELFHTNLTGVIRSHRRRGVATAVKVNAIQVAQQMGARAIETNNEENNPMYGLNMMLGFQPTPAMVDLVKKLE